MDLKVISARYAKSKPSHDPMSPRSSLDIDETTTSELETRDLLGSSERNGKAKRGDDVEPSTRSKVFRRMLQIFSSLLCLGFMFSAYDLYRESTAWHSFDKGKNAQPCGMDPVTARSRGCMFDPISIAWLPERCHDFDLADEFLEVEQWQFWENADGINPISLAEVREGHHSTLFVRETYLRHRCVFAWRKTHRAIINGAAVDGYTTDWTGLMDCEEIFRNLRNDSGDLNQVVVGYPSCG